MQTITVSQLKNKLAELKACTAVSMETETYPKMLKTDRVTNQPNPYTNIVKIGTMAGLIGGSYENSVNNQLGREDKELVFQAKERKWGKLMDNKILVAHTPKNETKEKYYLQILIKSAKKPIYSDGNHDIPVEELTGVLPTNEAPKTQESLEKKVILRDIALDNIKVLKMNQEIFQVVKDEEYAEMEKTTLINENSESIKRAVELYDLIA